MNTAFSALVANDDDHFREMLVEYLTREGFRVSQAVDGAEALVRLTRESFQLILIDVNMPFLSGPEVVARLDGLGPDTRILFMTGEATRAQLAIAYASDRDFSVLRKPFKLTTFGRYLAMLVPMILENDLSRELRRRRTEAWNRFSPLKRLSRRMRFAVRWLRDSLTLYIVLISLILTALVTLVVTWLPAPQAPKGQTPGQLGTTRDPMGFERR